MRPSFTPNHFDVKGYSERSTQSLEVRFTRLVYRMSDGRWQMGDNFHTRQNRIRSESSSPIRLLPSDFLFLVVLPARIQVVKMQDRVEHERVRPHGIAA